MQDSKSMAARALEGDGDTISRQAAIDAMRKLPKWNVMREDYKNVGFSYDDVMFTLEKLPSAQPERKKGKWIWWYEEKFTEYTTEYTPHCKCSECGRECAPSVATYSNFCRNCGADMRGEEHD